MAVAGKRLHWAAIILGVAAGLLGLYHGANEVAQGSNSVPSLLICAVANQPGNCAPATTVLPTFESAGIATLVVAVLVLVTAVVGPRYDKGPWAVLGLSIALVLTGGGGIAVILGIVAGLLGRSWRRRARLRGTSPATSTSAS